MFVQIFKRKTPSQFFTNTKVNTKSIKKSYSKKNKEQCFRQEAQNRNEPVPCKTGAYKAHLITEMLTLQSCAVR